VEPGDLDAVSGDDIYSHGFASSTGTNRSVSRDLGANGDI
jgi:hypothetical protein